MAPPPNNDFANAEVITGGSGSTSGTTIDATPDWPPTEFWFGDGNVWYAWTCPVTCAATFTLSGDIVDTDNHTDPLITVYTGPDFAGQLYRATGFSFFGSSPIEASFVALAGTTYYIEVDYYTTVTPGATFALAWSSLVPTELPSRPNVQVITSTLALVDLFILPAGVFFDPPPTYPEEAVTHFEVWSGTTPATSTLLTTITLPSEETPSTVDDGEAEFIDNSPFYPSYYRVKACNPVGCTWSDLVSLPGPSDNITVGTTAVGETAGTVPLGSSFDIVVTADVPGSSPEAASWLVIVIVVNRQPRGGVYDPTYSVTDNAPVGDPYNSPNVQIGDQWGNNGLPRICFVPYLVLNPLSPGDIVTVTSDLTFDFVAARLHPMTRAAYPQPFNPLQPDFPRPPYNSPTPLRQSGEVRSGTNHFDTDPITGGTQRWFSDLTFMFGEIIYSDAISPPLKFFADDNDINNYDWSLDEQFSFDDIRLDVGHPFFARWIYSFALILPQFTQQLFPEFSILPILPNPAGLIGMGTYHSGVGPPYPATADGIHILKTVSLDSG